MERAENGSTPPFLLLKVATPMLVRNFLRTTTETSHDSYYSTIGVSIPHERESQDPSHEHEATP